jgi:hypothetical protein
MLNKRGQKNFVFGILVVVTIVILIVIIAMWMDLGTLKNNQGEIIEPTIVHKLLLTFGGMIILLIGYLLFNHQKNLDKKNKLNLGRFEK